MKNPCCQAHIWSKERQSCQNYTLFWVKKVAGMPFFSIFVWKITALMPIFCRKNVHSLKNTLFSFHEKPPAVKPNGQKSHKSVKTTLYYGPKKSKGYPFFPIFHEKMTARMTIFCQKKYSFSKKHTAIIPIFVQKNVNSL